MPQRGLGALEPNAQVPSRMGRKRDRADSEAETEEGKRRSLPAGEPVHGEAPALTIDERRAAAGRAMARFWTLSSSKACGCRSQTSA